MTLHFIRRLLKSSRSEQDRFFSQQIPLSVFKTHEPQIRWVYEYRTRHGVYPSMLAFRSRFPGVELPKSSEPLGAIVSTIVDSDLFEQLSEMVKKGETLYKSGRNSKDIAEFFRRSSHAIRLYDASFVDSGYDPRSVLKKYREMVVKKAKGIIRPPSPWGTFNDLIGTFLPGEVAVIAARTSMGKAQPLDAKVLTPSGFVPMGSLEVGDPVVDKDGYTQKVTAVYPQGQLKVFRVYFSDGTSTECCKDHLWLVQNHHRKKSGDYAYEVRSLNDLLSSGIRTPDGRIKWNVPKFKGWQTPNVRLPASPWLVGALIGNGCFVSRPVTFSSGDPEVIARLQKSVPVGVEITPTSDSITVSICGFNAWVDRIGFERVHSFKKRIPFRYLYAGYSQRFQLLQGLMDTDGYVYGPGFEYSTSSPGLAMQVLALVRSLGGFARVASKIPTYTYRGERRIGRRTYVVRFTFDDDREPFTCARHRSRFTPSWKKPLKGISHVVELPKAECQCIAVTGGHTYVTDDFIVTHNTWLALEWAHYLEANGERVLVISKELPTPQVLMRWTAIHERLNYHDLRHGTLSPKQLRRFAQSAVKYERAESNLLISGTELISGVGFSQIIQKIQEFAPTVLVVDGAYLIYPEEKFPNDQQRFAYSSAMLRRISGAHGLKSILVVQAKREAEAETISGVTKAALKDIYGADNWAQDADFVLLINGKRGAPIRTVHLDKGRESDVGSWVIDFKLAPYPIFREIEGMVEKGAVKFQGVA